MATAGMLHVVRRAVTLTYRSYDRYGFTSWIGTMILPVFVKK